MYRISLAEVVFFFNDFIVLSLLAFEEPTLRINQVIVRRLCGPCSAVSNKEVDLVRDSIKKVFLQLNKNSSIDLKYKLGVMVETPRAALRAGDIAQSCDFLSFGTNDLTQMTYGLSRDDSNRFMKEYIEKELFSSDPFKTIDVEGVGELLEIAVQRARNTNSKIVTGLCGEHGGDPSSISFCRSVGFEYISCSPYRVPIARLAAAQSRIRNKN